MTVTVNMKPVIDFKFSPIIYNETAVTAEIKEIPCHYSPIDHELHQLIIRSEIHIKLTLNTPACKTFKERKTFWYNV